MKKIILLALSVFVLFAEGFDYKLKELFYSRLSTYDLRDSYKNYEKDPLLKKAEDYLKNKKLYITKTIIDGDPEEGIPLKKVKIKVPDYKKVLEILYRDVKLNKNPIAAFYGLYIINNVYLENKPKFFIMKREFAKTLALNSQNCDGYLYYGKYLMEGIGGKRELVKAFEIFNRGMEKCGNKE